MERLPPKPKLATSGFTRKILLYGLGLSVLCLVITLLVLSIGCPYMGVDIRLKDGSWKVTSVDPSGLAQAEGIKSGYTVTAVNVGDPSEFAATTDRLPIRAVDNYFMFLKHTKYLDYVLQ